MKLILLALASLLLASVASAQTGLLVSNRIQFLQNGAILPTQVMTLTAWTCGQAKVAVPAGTVFIDTAPARVTWDDPANPAFDCISVQTGGVLFSLPLGNNYTATAVVTNDFGASSPPSAPSNSFTRGARPSPPAVTGLRVVP